MAKTIVKYMNIFKYTVKYIVKNIGFLAILGIAVGTAVFFMYWPILDMLGLSDIREHLDSIGGSVAIAGGIAGGIAGFIGVRDMAKNTDLLR